MGTAVEVLQVKVWFRGCRSAIWRLEVPARITLAGLHAVLQTAFGWIDSHLRFAGEHLADGVPGSSRVGAEPDPA